MHLRIESDGTAKVIDGDRVVAEGHLEVSEVGIPPGDVRVEFAVRFVGKPVNEGGN